MSPSDRAAPAADESLTRGHSPTAQLRPRSFFARTLRAALHMAGAAPLLFLASNFLLLAIDLIALYNLQLLSTVTTTLSQAAERIGSGTGGGHLAHATASPGYGFISALIPANSLVDGYLFVLLVPVLLVLRVWQKRIGVEGENTMLVRLRLELHDGLLTLGPAYHQKHDLAFVVQLVDVYSRNVMLFLGNLLAAPLTRIIPLLTALLFLYYNLDILGRQNGAVLAALFLVLLMLPVLGWQLAKRVELVSLYEFARLNELNTEFTNSLAKPLEVELMGALPQRDAAYGARLRAEAVAQAKQQWNSYAALQIESAIPSILQALFLFYGIWMMQDSPASVGAIVGLYLFVPQVTNPVQNLITVLTRVRTARPQVESVLEVLDAEAEPRGSGGHLELTPDDRAISLRHVEFAYGAVAVLKDVSLDIAAGKVTAIVARSGGGKSTIFNLITGLDPPAGGTVLIGNKDVSEINPSSLHRRIVKVSQEPLLITASVRDNFRLAKADAGDAEIEAVCRLTGMWQVLAKKTGSGADPLECPVTREESRTLSGGERRLLAVTRALMLKPSVLLLDEPTTGLDPVSRQTLCETLSRVTKGMTVVLVDHNMEFVERLADEVCCLDDGRIVASGAPQALLGRDTLFAQLKQAELNPLLGAVAATRTAAEWIALVKEREGAGELLLAFDFARKGLAEHPGEVWLRYLAVRVLARSGATQQATDLYRQYELQLERAPDIVALDARILKDEAWRTRGAERPARLLRSAEAYAAIFERGGASYPGVNAATLFTLAGDPDRGGKMAAATATACDRESAETPRDAYFLEATRAELALLRGDGAAASGALARAVATGYRNLADYATTRKQLRAICDAKNVSPDILMPLRPPGIIHYLGHMIAPAGSPGRFPADQEKAVATRIAAYLKDHDIGFAYGSLACGADILFAEAILARGAELHAVLPFDVAEFKEVSVVRGGSGWAERFDACLAGAKSVLYATEDEYLGDNSLFPYGTRLAMGTAILRARWLDAEVREAAVWDGNPASGVAGTAIDMAAWRATGRAVDVIEVMPTAGAAVTADGAPRGKRPKREVRALLFGDFQGYSQVREHDVPVFQATFMTAIAEVLDRFGDEVIYRNSWGDAIYVVLRDAVSAARCALAIQAHLKETGDGGLPVRPELRLSGHYGPTFAGFDAIRKEPTFFGAAVTRAARLEPVTPVNLVYVTEPFAAALALEDAAEFTCEYVGQHPAAKNYGTMRMYMLRGA
jgi:ABC-type multidrug transport system fused ATPase/permease subunit